MKRAVGRPEINPDNSTQSEARILPPSGGLLRFAAMAASLVAGAFFATLPASAQPFSKVIVFGESNVDAGF